MDSSAKVKTTEHVPRYSNYQAGIVFHCPSKQTVLGGTLMKRTLMVGLLSLGLAISAFGSGAGTKAPKHNKFAQKQAKLADKQEDKSEKGALKAECKNNKSAACKQAKRDFKAEEKAEKQTAKK